MNPRTLVCYVCLVSGAVSGCVETIKPPSTCTATTIDPTKVLFQNCNLLENATRSDTLTVQKEVQGLRVTLNACSQSETNYSKNSIRVRFLQNGNEIANKSQSYDSESVTGTPIPCHDHVIDFPAIWLKSGDSISMETTVTRGDYRNDVNNETVSVDDGTSLKQESCSAFAPLPFSGGFLSNNIWGGVPVQQCVFSRADGSLGWKSEWQASANSAINYPEAVCGQKPWDAKSSTTLLPVALSVLAKTPLVVTWDIESHGTGNRKLALEGWITSGMTPTPETIVAEVMVVPSATGMVPHGTQVESVTPNIDGALFDLYRGTRSDAKASWTFFTLVPRQSAPTQGSVDFGKVITWLANNGYLASTASLASVELGDEIMSGRIRTVLKKYAVTLGQQSVCQLP